MAAGVPSAKLNLCQPLLWHGAPHEARRQLRQRCVAPHRGRRWHCGPGWPERFDEIQVALLHTLGTQEGAKGEVNFPAAFAIPADSLFLQSTCHRRINIDASIVAKCRFRTIIPVAAKSASGEGERATNEPVLRLLKCRAVTDYPARRGRIS